MSDPAESSTPSLRAMIQLTRRIEAIHRELGIPASYAVDRRLAPYFEADEHELVEIPTLEPRPHPMRLLRPAAAAWKLLSESADRDGIMLVPLSGFRSIKRQTEILRDKLMRGQRLEEILRVVAAPGFSEHHTGRALDLGTPGECSLEESFAATAAFRWLEQNGTRFGFRLSFPRGNAHGIAYEPWHWCWSA